MTGKLYNGVVDRLLDAGQFQGYVAAGLENILSLGRRGLPALLLASLALSPYAVQAQNVQNTYKCSLRGGYHSAADVEVSLDGKPIKRLDVEGLNEREILIIHKNGECPQKVIDELNKLGGKKNESNPLERKRRRK